MNIAIDLTPLPSQVAGVGNYALSLTQGLAQVDKNNRYSIFMKREHIRYFNTQKDNFRIFFVNNLIKNRFFRILWEQFILPLHLTQLDIDILHSIHYTTPLLSQCKRVITFPDMTFLLYPEKHTFMKRVFFKFFVPVSARKADRLIAMSENTKKDIMDILNIHSSKIDVVYGTMGSSLCPGRKSDAINQIKRKYGIRDKFILYVGTLEPRKNVKRLIEAYALLVNKNKVKHQLVIVGKKGWACKEICDLPAELGLSKTERVLFTGYVSEDDLSQLYNGADLFVYPSLYEGFGIPPLEALSYGVPTITSNVSSLPEIVGDAGLLVNPYDVEGLSEAMYKILSNKELRQKLKIKGPQRARIFSRKRLARETLQVYNRVAKEQ